MPDIRPGIRIALVDDHRLFRAGVRTGLSDAVEVVGEAGTVADALEMASIHHPDVVVTDIRLPDGSGLDVTRELRAEHPTLGIVVLTMYAGDDQLFGALEAGASAFVPKDSAAENVVAAARHALASPNAFSAGDLADAVRRRISPDRPRLSQRESQVLQLLADGMSVANISKKLYVSESTAKTHISKLYEKLGAGNRAQALMTALKLGLLQTDPRAPD